MRFQTSDFLMRDVIVMYITHSTWTYFDILNFKMFYKENNILHEYMDSTVFVVHTVLVIYRGNV